MTRFILGVGTGYTISGYLNKGFLATKSTRKSKATKYPTESGIELVDNVYIEPWTIEIQGLVPSHNHLGESPGPSVVWQTLKSMQDRRERMMYFDPKNSYSNLVIVHLEDNSSSRHGLGLLFTVRLQEIRDATIGTAGTFDPNFRYDVADSNLKKRLPPNAVAQASATRYYPIDAIGSGERTAGEVERDFARTSVTHVPSLPQINGGRYNVPPPSPLLSGGYGGNLNSCNKFSISIIRFATGRCGRNFIILFMVE